MRASERPARGRRDDRGWSRQVAEAVEQRAAPVRDLAAFGAGSGSSATGSATARRELGQRTPASWPRDRRTPRVGRGDDRPREAVERRRSSRRVVGSPAARRRRHRRAGRSAVSARPSSRWATRLRHGRQLLQALDEREERGGEIAAVHRGHVARVQGRRAWPCRTSSGSVPGSRSRPSSVAQHQRRAVPAARSVAR